ncbi:MAG: HAMP domain-containing protein [Proteobacteria bacterium]|nr:MAG: HAMP domain-containing protein [Pseudomonadota bacterium]
MPIRVPLQIRWKLLLAMLAIGISPLIISAWLNVRGLSELGAMLAQQSGQALSEQTRANLEQMADNYTRLVDRERQFIELLVRIQAADAEKLLGAAAPQNGGVYWSDAFDRADEALKLQTLPERYQQPNAAGEQIPAPVSFVHQAFFAASPVKRSEVLAEAVKLSRMTTLYREAHRHHSDIVYRQYVALENGLIATFPGHGGYPAEFDPRERSWYREQKAARDFHWSSPHTDTISRRAIVTATMPIMDPGGSFAGVAGTDIRLTSLLQSLVLPPHLSAASDVLLTTIDPVGDTADLEIVIVAKTTGNELGRTWRELPRVERLVLGNERDLNVLKADMRNQRGGTIRTRYAGRDMFCVYRPFGENRSYLVFLVSATAVVDPAMRAAQYALASTKRQVDALIPIAIAIILAVALIAFVSSKTITDPINRLVDAATRIGQGDFDVRVAIKTGDELERLGDVFNEMVPQLEEHTRVREALNLASEVQRHLLPDGCPTIDGIDVAGFSIYCDQTGGDYYDFLDLSSSHASRIGIALGDVSGHGIASALLMTTVRALLRGVADSTHSPAEILQHISRKLADDVHAGRFMTLFYLLVDLDRRTIEWASAGHDPAIRYNPHSDSFSVLEGRDIPLGIDKDWHYCDTQVEPLIERDLIMLGTDGIWETRNAAGEFFGKARLRTIIGEKHNESAQAICDHIVYALQQFRGTEPQRDDVTAVVFRFTA